MSAMSMTTPAPTVARPTAALRRAVEFVLATPDLFLNTTSDARLLSAIFAASDSHDGTAPAPRDLSDDRAELGIEPLFDGARLENVRVG